MLPLTFKENLMNQHNSTNPSSGKSSTIGVIAMAFGGLLVIICLLSVLNTAFDWRITLNKVPLPATWETTIGLSGVAVFFWAIYAFLTYVGPVRRFGQRRPWVMALLVVLGIVGVIVGITIWDNGNIAERHAAWAADAKADSLDRIEEGKAFFNGQPVPYRLAILNPENAVVQVWIDSQQVATIAPLQATEIALPWQTTKIQVTMDGKVLATTEIKPDAAKGQDPATLHVYSPLKNIVLWLFDYDGGYVDGKLQPDKEFEPQYEDSYYMKELFDIEKAGPFYILPNQKAPATSTYHAYRLVYMLPDIEDASDNRPFAAWMMRRLDASADGAPAETVQELYEIWKAE
jgi:hypothetical protein